MVSVTVFAEAHTAGHVADSALIPARKGGCRNRRRAGGASTSSSATAHWRCSARAAGLATTTADAALRTATLIDHLVAGDSMARTYRIGIGISTGVVIAEPSA